MNRNSNFELLRIVSMLMIVMCHFAAHGTLNIWNFYAADQSVMRTNLFFLFFGPIGVSMFVMIGSYFLCLKKFNFKRPLMLMLQTMFYSFAIYLFLIKAKLITVHLGLESILLPFPLPSGYWFVAAYLVMLLGMPVFNLIINSFNKKQLSLLIFAGVIIYGVLPDLLVVFNGKPDFGSGDFGYSNFMGVIIAYFVGAYLRKFPEENFWHNKFTGIIVFLSFLLLCVVSMLATSEKVYGILVGLTGIYGPVALFIAASMFSFFRTLSFHSKIINVIARSTFGVYLIHDNTFLRSLIWQKWFSTINFAHAGSLHYVLSLIGCVVLVYVTCTIIDIVLYQMIVGRMFQVFASFINEKLMLKFNEFLEDDRGKNS